MSAAIAELIDGLEIFRDFSYRELEVLGGYLGQMKSAAGSVIFNEGDPGSHLLILISGRISIYKTGENGRHLLSYENRGRVIGEMALLDRERRSALCVADTDCELLTLTHDGLDRLATGHPVLAYRFMAALARRLRRTSGVLAEHLLN